MSKLEAFHPSRNTDSAFYILERSQKTYLVKHYKKNAEERYSREKRMLKYWKESGYHVPLFYDDFELELSQPYLVMQFLSGKTLAEIFSDETVSYDYKLKLIEKLFISCSKRHTQALQNLDRELIHRDMNLDNIILYEDKLYYIDFEHESKVKVFKKQLAKEISTLCRRILNLIGPEYTEETMTLLVKSYTHQLKILHLVVKFSYGRISRIFHMLGARENKKHNLVTKYEIVMVLKKLLKEHKSS
ncbi:RIO1 family regulatory kinase/ATPase [Candidatus Uabimicrobium sp. HlEnr_7]|uniref:RIO1 family regulatory kinase/ATPase domain-containing protein n=1 Tax=Candidatus Uabimicrobium helgolandensis TaxID=3095367 RepID=UPI00355611DE